MGLVATTVHAPQWNGFLASHHVEEDCWNSPEFADQLASVVRKACAQAGKLELLEDALQEAWAVCVRMSHDYDAFKGISFLNFVRSHVYWAALHYCKSNSGAFSIPDRMWRNRKRDRHDELAAAIYTVSLAEDDEYAGETFDRLSQIPDGDSVGGVYCGSITRDIPLWRQFDYEHLHMLVQRLEPNERNVVARYGDGLNCADIAREIGVTRQRVHQLLKRAFTKIREWWDEPTAA
jgi:RNA polymerase sigma factor (sigma-70 family)